VPWTPSAAVRHDLEQLADEGGLDLTVTQWPLPRQAVLSAVESLRTSPSSAIDQARVRVLHALGADERSHLSATVQSDRNFLAAFGDDATRGSSVAVRSSTFTSVALSSQVGVRVESSSGLAEDRKLRLDDSALVTELAGIELQAWSHRSWWGPGWQSSLILSNNAPSFNGAGIQRASASRSESPWLSWLGPWNFDIFVAQTEDVATPANPYLIGQRLTFKPFSNLEIGLTRTAQWGGRGREQTAKSFLRMLTGQGVNGDTPQQQKADPANEMAGFDVRIKCPFGVRCAGYVQGIGEDQAGVLPSHYLGLYGVEAWSEDGLQRYYAEYVETGCRAPIGRPILRGCAYRNYAYPQGYTSAGRWMGASVGPDSRLLTLGWMNVGTGTTIRVSAGGVGSRIATYTPLLQDPDTSGRMLGLVAKQVFEWGSTTLTPELDLTRINTSTGVATDARVLLNLQMSLDPAYQVTSDSIGSSLSSSTKSALEPLWVSAGLVVGAALLDRPVDNYASAHAQNPSGRALAHAGSAIPIGAFGLAGLSWVLQHGSAQGDLAFSALEAGVAAAGISEIGKYAIDRARPLDNRGATSFGAGARQQSSFPSIHTAVAWAVLTPYARYYDAPWLYGLAALTNVGRVGARDHWLSDTVAGATLGYYLGDLVLRHSGVDLESASPRLWITPRSIHLETSF
jgi:membrane-associated phospholipid phosphatase